ncbi:MAG: CPBP family intramembrane glutamic endopeptidase [Halanaerobiaceae bacterium]
MKEKELKENEKIIFILISLLVIFFWYIIFIWQPLSFWVLMSGGNLFLVLIAITWKGKRVLPDNLSFKDIILGLISAFILYYIFWLGYYMGNLIFPFVTEKVAEIYTLTDGYNNLILSALLLFIIGPGEEIFWRGLLQKQLGIKYSPLFSFLMVTIGYTLVHFLTGSLVLAGAAAAAGLFWGVIYWHQQSLWMVIISHAVWDVLILILMPIS